jgi:hypothetical protein
MARMYDVINALPRYAEDWMRRAKRHRTAGVAIVLLALGTLAPIGSSATTAGLTPAVGPAAMGRLSQAAEPPLPGRIVAVGIPGIAAISPVGTFHTGGPIHDRPEFAMFTQAGQILDPDRILVSSSSNFGAPIARQTWATGAILSIDPRGEDTVVVPPTFVTGANQGSALGGRVRLFTSQSPAFVNGAYNPSAVTASAPAVSAPTGISLNNAFGRLWFTGTPSGATGDGFVSVVDADGRPLADAPNRTAGGVFVGTQTNRSPQLVAGTLESGTLANALMGASPDGSNRAVFAAVTADGSIVQVHVEKGVDGLAPAGTIQALTQLGADGPSRTGMLFNWVPNQILYVADPRTNGVVALTVVDDGTIFQVEQTRRLTAPELNVPIDLAPAVPEIANPRFSSNTTLAGGSDIYVANRGDGTIVRLSQDGNIVAIRQVDVPGLGVLGAGRLNGIAVSPGADRIWVTVSGPQPGFGDVEGAVVEVEAFGSPTASYPSAPNVEDALVARGADIFRRDLTLEEGLGPLFNARS